MALLDVAVTGDSVPSKVLHYDGHAFTDVSATAGVSWTRSGRTMAWVDYDRDNWPDLFLDSLGGAQPLPQQPRRDVH